MKKFLIKEDIFNILLLIFFAWSMSMVIIAYGKFVETEIERNSYIEPVLIPEKKVIVEDEGILGVASFYDYVLKDGWSSLGHFVCATRDFERYAMVKVTNLDNGKTVVCKKTDYGPDASVHPDRVVDLSSTAFVALAPLSSGLIKNVKIEKVK